MSLKLTPQEIDKVLFPVVERFFQKSAKSATKIAKEVASEYSVPVNREQIYPLLRIAVARGIIIFVPPRDAHLKGMMEKFPNKGDVNVIDVAGPRAAEYVSDAGADVVLDLIREIGKERRPEPVHLGLGIGRTTMGLARRLGRRIRSDPNVPPLVVHALSTPYSTQNPLETPVAFFSYFADALYPAEFVNLGCEPFLEPDKYEEVIDHSVVKESFDRKHEIDIAVTSLASSSDEHGYLKQYLDKFGEESASERLLQRGWKGDAQLRAYSDEGPLPPRMMKPVTLFELEEFVELARRDDKHIVLLCGPCGNCDSSKVDALLPLLKEPSLHIWSHLVVDRGTAMELVSRQFEL